MYRIKLRNIILNKEYWEGEVCVLYLFEFGSLCECVDFVNYNFYGPRSVAL